MDPGVTAFDRERCDAVALYGPIIGLFGSDILQSVHCHSSKETVATPVAFADVAEACGGPEAWHAFVSDCVATVGAAPGGLRSNWFTLQAGDGDEKSGIRCLTCCGDGNGKAQYSFGGGRRQTGSPFTNFLSKHLKSVKHERERDAVLAQLEAAGAGAPRTELAMRILASRLGLGPLLDQPELQPIGSEPTGATTRSRVWSSVQPDRPATKQEELDAKLGRGAYLVNADGTLAGCLRCSLHQRRLTVRVRR